MQIVLEKFAPLKSPRIPAAIMRIVQHIERRGLTEEGLYRVSGSAEQVKKLKREMFKNKIRDVVRESSSIAVQLLTSLFHYLFV